MTAHPLRARVIELIESSTPAALVPYADDVADDICALFAVEAANEMVERMAAALRENPDLSLTQMIAAGSGSVPSTDLAAPKAGAS